jgi:GT2 family glycosyltransferase
MNVGSLNPDLAVLADILADWIEPAPNVPAIYLFGSRVRGDHRPDSDVDVRLFLNEWRNVDTRDMEWWTKENETDFAALKARLPGPLAVHLEQHDDADASILEGRQNPLLVVRRVVCVWTPHKTK